MSDGGNGMNVRATGTAATRDAAYRRALQAFQAKTNRAKVKPVGKVVVVNEVQTMKGWEVTVSARVDKK